MKLQNHTDDSLFLRRFRQDDRDTLVKLADNAKVSQYLTDRFPNPYTHTAADIWIDKVSSEQEPHNFLIEWQGEFVGGIGLSPFDDVYRQTAEIGYWLGEPYWGNGLATKAVALMLNHTFSNLQYIRIQAGVFAENKSSARVLEKNGFILEGILRQHITKNGRRHDAMLYARLRDQR
jgi:RimJ/RimL family protein N-acetyltransferase